MIINHDIRYHNNMGSVKVGPLSSLLLFISDAHIRYFIFTHMHIYRAKVSYYKIKLLLYYKNIHLHLLKRLIISILCEYKKEVWIYPDYQYIQYSLFSTSLVSEIIS